MENHDPENGFNSPRTQADQGIDTKQASYVKLCRANDWETKLGGVGAGEVFYGENPDDPTDRWAVKMLAALVTLINFG